MTKGQCHIAGEKGVERRENHGAAVIKEDSLDEVAHLEIHRIEQ